MRPRHSAGLARGLLCVRALALTGLVTATPHAQAQTDTGRSALSAAVAKLARDSGIQPGTPGIAVLAKRPDRVLLAHGYGLAELTHKRAITACTRFELASISKSMTATAVLILQARGLLSLDDDVRKFIPELPSYASGPVRIRDMLQHVSGLTSYFDLENVPKSHKTYWVNTDYLAALGKAPLDFPTGQKYEYNNTNYMLMPIIISRATRKPFASVMQEEIFTPAGMRSTFIYAGPGSIRANATPGCADAVGYEREKGNWVASWGLPPSYRQPEHLEVGDGGIWSNLEDMAQWDAAVRTNKLVTPAIMRLALTGSRKNKSYGLGWQIYSEGKGQLYGFGHDGYWSGFSTMYYNYRTDDHTTVLLSNRGGAIDLDKFWEKLSGLIDRHAME